MLITFVVLIPVLALGLKLQCGVKKDFVCQLSIYPNGNYINWTCPDQKQQFIDKGLYESKRILPTRFEITNDIAFIVTPRFLSGVPFTLGFLHLDDPCKPEPILSPFPDWETHDPDGQAIVNAVDINIDKNHILWVLDVGIIETLVKAKVVGPPKLYAFCLQAWKIVAEVNLSKFYSYKSRFHEIQVEVTEVGNTFIYISDAGSTTIVVWDLKKDTGYQVRLPNELSDDSSDKDILYIVLLNKYLYFTFMSGCKVFRTRTCNLRESKVLDHIEEVGTKPGKFVILGSDGDRTIFFRSKGSNQIYKWDTTTAFNPDHCHQIAQPPPGTYSTHAVVADRKIVWALSSNFPDFASENTGAVGPYVKLHPICVMKKEPCEEGSACSAGCPHSRRAKCPVRCGCGGRRRFQ